MLILLTFVFLLPQIQTYVFFYLEISFDTQLCVSMLPSNCRYVIKGYQGIKSTILLNMEFHMSSYICWKHIYHV